MKTAKEFLKDNYKEGEFWKNEYEIDFDVVCEFARDYAIAMCDYQKKECAEKLDIADAHFTNDDGYEWLASNIVSETKNVAE